MRYMGKTAAISNEHFEQFNWTVLELPSALPWNEAKILLFGHRPFLSHKKCTQYLTPLTPKLPLTYLPSKLQDSIKIQVS